MPMAEPARVALLVTCLVDLFRPTVGFAAIKLLEAAGCTVEVPRARPVAVSPPIIPAIAPTRRPWRGRSSPPLPGMSTSSRRRVPAPGWCGCIIRNCSPTSRPTCAAARELAARTHELVSFLVDVRGMDRVAARHGSGRATYHDACSGLRELAVKAQPRRLLAAVEGLTPRRIAGGGDLLRVRRHVLRQIPGNLGQDGDRQGGRHCRDGGRRGAGGRSGLSAQHRRKAVAARIGDRGSARRRGARRHDRRGPGDRAQGLTGCSRPAMLLPTTPAPGSPTRPCSARSGLAQTGFPAKRAQAVERLPEFEALRDEGRAIKDHTLAHLDFYLDLYERNVTARGRPCALGARRGRGARRGAARSAARSTPRS